MPTALWEGVPSVWGSGRGGDMWVELKIIGQVESQWAGHERRQTCVGAQSTMNECMKTNGAVFKGNNHW